MGGWVGGGGGGGGGFKCWAFLRQFGNQILLGNLCFFVMDFEYFGLAFKA